MLFTILLLLAAGVAYVFAAPLPAQLRWEHSMSLVERSPAPPEPAQDRCGAPPPPPSSLPTGSSQSSGTLGNDTTSFLHFEERASSSGSCNVQQAIQYMNLTAVSPALPAPSSDLKLFQVTIGRGTQNYTCDLSNATAVPVPVGALATLYDSSCVAAKRPTLLHRLPQIALNQPIPTPENTNASVVNHLEVGHHYFINSTTPFFNLDTASHDFGMGAMAKVDASNAPAGASVGAHGDGNGAVQWLYLDSLAGFAEHHWKAVYRLNTAGGDAPKTCTGQPAAFELPYAAEYWLFT